MERSCYRCGAQVEEHTTFCPSCGAAQIKVTAPAGVPADPGLSPPLDPGSPDSTPQPELPLQVVPSGQIRWRSFWRIALIISMLNGLAFIFLGLFGLSLAGMLVFVVGIAFAIVLYRPHHQGPLLASQGARLGAFAGLLSFAVLLFLTVLAVAPNPGEYRKQLVLAVQQQTAGNPDPRAQQVAQFVATRPGLILFTVFLVIFTLAFFVVLSSAVGALTAAFSRSKTH
jgi:hypothetical protein